MRLSGYIYFRWKLINKHYFPKATCIIVSNHVSFLDPPLIGAACPPTVWYLARDTLMGNYWKSIFFKGLHCIPVSRNGGDIRGVRLMLKTLKNGHSVLMFPEGTRSVDGKMSAIKKGVGLIAHKSKVPILPVYIHGTHSAMKKGSVWVSPKKIIIEFCELIYPEEQYCQRGSEDIYQSIANQIEKSLQKMEKKYHLLEK